MKAEDMSMVELKAAAYDKIALKEQISRELVQINNLIVRKIKEAENEHSTGNQRSPEKETEGRKPEIKDYDSGTGKQN